MTKHFRLIFLLAWIILMLVGCGSAAELEPATVGESANVVPEIQATNVPAIDVPVASTEVPPTSTAVPPTSTTIPPTEPPQPTEEPAEEVVIAAAKPQFLEFYTEW